MTIATLDGVSAVLKHMYGPRPVARGNYAQACAMRELERRRGTIFDRADYVRASERLGCTAIVEDPLAMLYAEWPIFGLIGSEPKPRSFDTWDIEQMQRPRCLAR
jgi:hypothetical protein